MIRHMVPGAGFARFGALFLAATLTGWLAASAPGRLAGATKKSVPFERGVTVGEWGPTAYEPGRTRATLRSLVLQQRVRSVTLFVVWSQANAFSTVVSPGSETAPTQNLVQAIRSAKALGLEVILRPYLDPEDGTWRGAIQPQPIDAWFRSYDEFILDYAAVARKEHVDGFVVGSELESMSQYADQWRALVRKVRARFPGFVTYQANWDEYQTVAWWDALDVIDISAYFPLAATPSYTVSDLTAAWAPWRDQIHAVQRRFRLPVVFGELGYRAVTGAAQRPWDTSLVGAGNPKDQALTYAATFRVWYRLPWFRGFQWWYVPPQPKLVAGLPGADHRPQGPALTVIRRWYARPR